MNINLVTSAMLAAVLLCSSPLTIAQQRRGEASKAPTAEIDAPPRTAESLNYQRSPRQDSVMSGGSFGNLPSWSGTVPGPCEINPELTGCGGAPEDPVTPPPSGGGTGGGTPLPEDPTDPVPVDPCVANPSGPGCDGTGSGGTPPPVTALVFPGQYTATSSYSHDAAASISLDITATSCVVKTTALKAPGQNRTFNCGALFASSADAAGYEIRLVASIYAVSDSAYSTPTYTQTTDWVPLGGISAQADTGHMVGGTLGRSEMSEVSGTYTVLVRYNGGAPQEVGVMDFAIDASAM